MQKNRRYHVLRSTKDHDAEGYKIASYYTVEEAKAAIRKDNESAIRRGEDPNKWGVEYVWDTVEHVEV